MAFTKEKGFLRERADSLEEASKRVMQTRFPELEFQKESVEGQLKAVQDASIGNLEEAVEFVYNQLMGIHRASGVYLERYTSFFGIHRKLASQGYLERVQVTNNTQGTLVLREGFRIRRKNSPQTEALVKEPLTLSAKETKEVAFVLVREGEIPFLKTQSAEEIEILTPVGDLSLLNLEDGLEGRLQETDSELRLRYRQSLVPQNNSMEGLLAQLTKIAGVETVFYRENTGSIPDGRGLLPHSVEFFIDGQLSDEAKKKIGEVLKNKPAGIALQGGEPIEVVYKTGLETLRKAVYYSRIRTVGVVLKVAVELDSDPLAPKISDSNQLLALLRNGAAAFVNGLPVGKDLLTIELNSAMIQVVLETYGGGIRKITTQLGRKDANPPGVQYQPPGENLDVEIDCKARVSLEDAQDVVITVSAPTTIQDGGGQ